MFGDTHCQNKNAVCDKQTVESEKRTPKISWIEKDTLGDENGILANGYKKTFSDKQNMKQGKYN